MPVSTFERATASSTALGTTVYTVPAGAVITIIGFRVSNVAANSTVCNAKINGVAISPKDLLIPVNGGYEFTDNAKLVAMAGDVITVDSTVDGDLDVYLSFMKQA